MKYNLLLRLVFNSTKGAPKRVVLREQGPISLSEFNRVTTAIGLHSDKMEETHDIIQESFKYRTENDGTMKFFVELHGKEKKTKEQFDASVTKLGEEVHDWLEKNHKNK